MQEIGEELDWDIVTLWSTRLPQQATEEVCVGMLANADLRIWKAECPVLTRPLGRGIAETSNSNPARQATFDGGFNQIGCEKGERDRHVDLADGAFFAPGDLLDISHLAGSDFIEPAPTTGDRRDKLGAGLGADRATILWRLGGRHHDLASPFHCRLRPWDVQNKSIMIQGAGRIAGRLCLELDRQLARLDLNADDVVADEVSVVMFCGILDMSADGGRDESLDLGRWYPAHRSGTPRLSVQEG
jgi:hypothetical protein